MHAYMYDELSRGGERTLVGLTVRDAIFGGEFSRALRAVGSEALKSDCSGIRRIWLG